MMFFKLEIITTQVEPTTETVQNIGNFLTFHLDQKSDHLSQVFTRNVGKSYSKHIFDQDIHWEWNEADLNESMTFDNLALDLKLKKTLLEDLDSYMNGKEYKKIIEKAWKRGYLLYGPPGTGKSSLTADHLKFDIFDLDLMNVYSYSNIIKIWLWHV
ncbi:P-loop containing nucleoside triphosphate hydrolase [Trema orientale]|uniref:P-loop containing nucleoside triphosphate hydrolase n=1 Tax=Trema orientale TaxID=63057 RepID=A0A2P5EQC2_TREOI|nr:P-loop containing nucleoside triphosphate hydrolase [Trema orientale]